MVSLISSLSPLLRTVLTPSPLHTELIEFISTKGSAPAVTQTDGNAIVRESWNTEVSVPHCACQINRVLFQRQAEFDMINR